MKRLLMDSKTALLYVHAVCLQLSHLSRSFSVPRSLLSSCSSFRLHVFLCIRRPMWASLACNVDVWDAAIDPFYRTAVHTGPRVVLIPDMQSTQRDTHTHTHTHTRTVRRVDRLARDCISQQTRYIQWPQSEVAWSNGPCPFKIEYFFVSIM